MARDIAKPGDTITGKTRTGQTVTGVVHSSSTEWYILKGVTTGGLVVKSSVTHVNGVDVNAAKEKPPIVKWAEGHEPGYETREVLAGRYRGTSVSDRSLLTHALIDGRSKTPCGKSEDTLSDVNVRANPTCARCASAVSKLKHS